MYTKDFEIRWSDMDANRHLANSAYINFMSHTRMGYFMENGFDQDSLAKNNLGPVVFYEHIYYFREVFMGMPIKVSLELKGLSEDGMYFEFVHNFYDYKGRNLATCEALGGWIDLKERKLTPLPDHMRKDIDKIPHTEDFRILSKEDTRKYGKTPKDLELKQA